MQLARTKLYKTKHKKGMEPTLYFLGIQVELKVMQVKEKVYAVRRFWEASDRPWRPFLPPNIVLGCRQA